MDNKQKNGTKTIKKRMEISILIITRKKQKWISNQTKIDCIIYRITKSGDRQNNIVKTVDESS